VCAMHQSRVLSATNGKCHTFFRLASRSYLHVAILAPALDVRALLAFRSYTKTQAGEVTRHMPLLPPIVLVLLVISSLLVVLLLLLRLRRSSCHDHAQRQTPSHRRAALTPTVRSHVLQRTQVHALAREI
jgi:hypothetical protein